ncbi:hypothetical protein LJR034_007018 [Caballeronia sp. LjRoot34]|uniref:hypothetical protein n=1 Tax=Caballeronia sp. LjRoot34 TaxID=3342325 RepID=UPI003ECCE8B3
MKQFVRGHSDSLKNVDSQRAIFQFAERNVLQEQYARGNIQGHFTLLIRLDVRFTGSLLKAYGGRIKSTGLLDSHIR